MKCYIKRSPKDLGYVDITTCIMLNLCDQKAISGYIKYVNKNWPNYNWELVPESCIKKLYPCHTWYPGDSQAWPQK
jgi:hypothetical protein